MAAAATALYQTTWRNKFLTAGCKTIHEMAEALRQAGDLLARMAADGVTLDEDGSMEDDYATLALVTNDRKLARKYGMEKAR